MTLAGNESILGQLDKYIVRQQYIQNFIEMTHMISDTSSSG